jgi:hypothetical protein
MEPSRYFMAVRRDGADTFVAPFPKIALPAPTLAAAIARLPDSLHSAYSVHPVSPRASRQIEAVTGGRA